MILIEAMKSHQPTPALRADNRTARRPAGTSCGSTDAALYVRLSREDTDGKHAGCDSIEVQTHDGTEAIRSQGWALDSRHLYVDDDVSGRRVSRPGWDDLLSAAWRGEFSVLVIRDYDRLARYDPIRGMRTLADLLDVGVKVWCYKDRGFLATSGTASIVTFVKAISSQEYAESIRTNTTAALRRRAERGQAVTRATLGYRIVDEGEGKGKRWQIEPDAAATVRHIADTFIASKSFYATARRLNEEGVRSKRGTTWRANVVRELLVRPIYRGTYVWGVKSAEPLVVAHPELRILSVEQEAAIEAILAGPRAKSWAAEPRHLATRLVRCGRCGGALAFTQSKRSIEPSLCCRRGLAHGCEGIGYKRESLVDAAIIGAVGALLVDEVWSATRSILREALEAQRASDDRAGEIDRLRRQAQSAQNRVANLTEAIAEAETTEERAPLRAKLGAEGKRLETLRAALKRAEEAPASESPAEILDEAERRVLDLRATLARGGIDALPAVTAILGEGKFSATREGERWILTARGTLASVYGDPGATRGASTRRRARARRWAP